MPDSNNYPLISIVLATYNGERYLKEQLDTVFQQTYSNLEIVAIDDCSSDTTVSILHHYASVHSNMKVYVNERNMGHIKAFEKGISLSTGVFIALCDQDDIWNKHKIELLMKEKNMIKHVTGCTVEMLILINAKRLLVHAILSYLIL